jgi:carbonic anhydrase
MKLMMICSLTLVVLLGVGCSAPNQTTQTDEPAPLRTVFTAEEQQAMTPDQVLARLKEGNQRFVAGELTPRDHQARVRAAVSGQHPLAIVLSCVDSRVPVEDIFDFGVGDIFVARVAGNFENEDILGSMEYATKVAGSKLVVVMGHEHCGAVKSAIAGAELGNITGMLDNIEPAIEACSRYEGEKSDKNPEYVHQVTSENVRKTIADIREKSPVMKELEDEGAIKIVGAMYDLDTGQVEFTD